VFGCVVVVPLGYQVPGTVVLYSGTPARVLSQIAVVWIRLVSLTFEELLVEPRTDIQYLICNRYVET
jgi:hypothetical protein